MRIVAVASAAALSLVACRTTSSGPAATTAPTTAPVEVKSTGTPGQAAATRVQQVKATVTAVDKAGRTVTIQGTDGSTETVKLGPEVKRFDEIAPGDVVAVELEQGLLLEYQAEGTPSVEPKGVAAAGRGSTDGAPAGEAAAGVHGTVTVSAIDTSTRVVTMQTPGGSMFQVKAGPSLALEKLKVGDRLLATYLETAAVRLEKAGK